MISVLDLNRNLSFSNYNYNLNRRKICLFFFICTKMKKDSKQILIFVQIRMGLAIFITYIVCFYPYTYQSCIYLRYLLQSLRN
jgi:hypothetical protein